MVNPLVPSFYYYKFAEAISSPYTSLNAFTSGAIDAQGKILKPESSIDPFEYFIIKLKKIFEQLPYGTTKASLSTYIPALRTFTEEAEKFGVTKEQFSFFVEGIFARETNGHVSYFLLNEEMGSANLGGPATSSGYNTGGVSGIDKPMGGGIARRKSVLGFEDSCEMFDVCPEEYIGFSSADAWAKVPDSESKKYIQRYQRSNPNKKMAIRNSDSGEIYFLKLKPRNLVEDYDILFLNMINENDIQIKDSNNDGKITTSDVIDTNQKDLEDDGIQNLSNSANLPSENEKKELHFLHTISQHALNNNFLRKDTKNYNDLEEGNFSIHRGSGGRDLVFKHDGKIIPIELGYTTTQRREKTNKSYIKKWISYTKEHIPRLRERFINFVGGNLQNKIAAALGKKIEGSGQRSTTKRVRTAANISGHSAFRDIGGLMLIGNEHGIELVSSAPHKKHPAYIQHEKLANSLGLKITRVSHPSQKGVSWIRGGFKRRQQTKESPSRGGTYGAEINIDTSDYSDNHPAVHNAKILGITPYDSNKIKENLSTLIDLYPKQKS